MKHAYRAESTLTDRYQTTIPEFIRETLQLNKRDKITYLLGEDGSVTLARTEKDDPVLGEFLSFMAKDMQKHPENIMKFPDSLVSRAKSVVAGMRVDLESRLDTSDDDE